MTGPAAGAASPADFPERNPLQVPRTPAAPGKFTFAHEEFGPGEHWFSASDDEGRLAGYGHVIEKPGTSASAPHVLISKLYVLKYRGIGIGSRLLEEIAGRFAGRELRLKPFPVEDGEQDAAELREFYARRGFTGYVPQDGDAGWDRWEYMTRQAPARPAGSRPRRASRLAAPRARGSRPRSG